MSKILTAATTSQQKDFRFGGGKGRLSIYGTFGSGTVSLKYRTAAGDAFRAIGTSYSGINAAHESNFELPTCDLQVDYTAGGGSSLTVEVTRYVD